MTSRVSFGDLGFGIVCGLGVGGLFAVCGLFGLLLVVLDCLLWVCLAVVWFVGYRFRVLILSLFGWCYFHLDTCVYVGCVLTLIVLLLVLLV